MNPPSGILGFSPLFIGAWVVGRVISSRLNRLSPGFSPLFIGAWVVGWSGEPASDRRGRFSPLFIGAWVVGRRPRGRRGRYTRFSPLFIGAWVVGQEIFDETITRLAFQSPIHRGLGCRFVGDEGLGGQVEVSVPYSSGLGLSAGQASRPATGGGVSVPHSSGLGLSASVPGRPRIWVLCFSPLFIGAWVVGTGEPQVVAHGPLFQSPIHRGLGCRAGRVVRGLAGWRVSVPYSSGLGLSGRFIEVVARRFCGFSPLFIGAWVVGTAGGGGGSAGQ